MSTTRYHSSRLGLTPKFLREAQRGMAAVEQHIEYKRELMAGDTVTVRTRVVGGRKLKSYI